MGGSASNGCVWKAMWADGKRFGKDHVSAFRSEWIGGGKARYMSLTSFWKRVCPAALEVAPSPDKIPKYAPLRRSGASRSRAAPSRLKPPSPSNSFSWNRCPRNYTACFCCSDNHFLALRTAASGLSPNLMMEHFPPSPNQFGRDAQPWLLRTLHTARQDIPLYTQFFLPASASTYNLVSRPLDADARELHRFSLLRDALAAHALLR